MVVTVGTQPQVAGSLTPRGERHSAQSVHRPRTPDERIDALRDRQVEVENEWSLLDHQVRRELNDRRRSTAGVSLVLSKGDKMCMALRHWRVMCLDGPLRWRVLYL